MPLAKRKRRKPLQHGTRYAYVDGCRCDLCKKANTEYMLQKKLLEIPPHLHGTSFGYCAYGCRCQECKEFKSFLNKQRKSRKKYKYA